MIPRRFATVAAVLCEAAFVACIAGFGSTGTANTDASPIAERSPPSLTTDAPPATATNAAVDNADQATVAVSVTATDKTATSDDPESIVKNAETVARSVAATDAAAASDEPKSSVETAEPKASFETALADSSQTRPPETPLVQVATASATDPIPVTTSPAVSPLEIVDECLVVDICIDRYLWTLYQRTPKQDSIKVDERRKVTVKRKGKLVTVTRTFTNVVDEDFAWKDPKAAEKAGMPMMDYVIGGMDRSFKLRLFQVLHAAEQAGLAPGITSAFRDDYRQSIASGLKAASDRSYHGGSFRGGYGHGLAADIVSVRGATRALRQASSEDLWKWVDAHGKEFGIGRPYLDRDPPHVAPTDGKEYTDHRGATASRAGSDTKKRSPHAGRDDRSAAKRAARSSKERTS